MRVTLLTLFFVSLCHCTELENKNNGAGPSLCLATMLTWNSTSSSSTPTCGGSATPSQIILRNQPGQCLNKLKPSSDCSTYTLWENEDCTGDSVTFSNAKCVQHTPKSGTGAWAAAVFTGSGQLCSATLNLGTTAGKCPSDASTLTLAASLPGSCIGVGGASWQFSKDCSDLTWFPTGKGTCDKGPRHMLGPSLLCMQASTGNNAFLHKSGSVTLHGSVIGTWSVNTYSCVACSAANVLRATLALPLVLLLAFFISM